MAEVVFHIHIGVFVACTRFQPEAFVFQLIVGVSSHDVAQLAVTVFGRIVFNHFAGMVGNPSFHFALVFAIDIFCAEVDVMHIGERVHIVGLHGVLLGVSVVVETLVIEVVRHILHIVILGVAAVACW